MAGTGQGYDLSAYTYSPDGRLFQIDYAQKCVDTSPSVLAICCKDGIIMATQKTKLSKMLVHGTNKRAYAITKNISCVVTGLLPDGRFLVDKARETSAEFKEVYGENMPAYMLADRMGSYMHAYTVGGGRPFGISMLIGAVEYHEASKTYKSVLFEVDPSGQVIKWFARAVGKGKQLGNTELEKLDLANLTCQDALFHCAKILHKVHDAQKAFELEINWICESSKYQCAVIPKDVLDATEAQAKKSIEDEDES